MEIVAFEPEMAGEVTGLYNQLIEPLPECDPVVAERFASIELLANKRLRDERVMVARRDGEAVGFVHVGVALPSDDEDFPPGEPGVIRFLSYRVGERSVGQALLERAEGWAREQGRAQIVAWPAALRYRFYHFGWAHLSERIAHVRGLLGMNGYVENNAEVFLTWHDYEAPEVVRPPVDFDVRIEWPAGPLGQRLSVDATAGPKEVGHCIMDWGKHSRPEAKEWCYCNSLWVTDKLQGKRLGMFLLSTALAEMKAKGCRHAAISTNAMNYRAQLMYANMGYRFADQTYSFRKELGE